MPNGSRTEMESRTSGDPFQISSAWKKSFGGEGWCIQQNSAWNEHKNSNWHDWLGAIQRNEFPSAPERSEHLEKHMDWAFVHTRVYEFFLPLVAWHTHFEDCELIYANAT